jgi:hypothetical protein
LLLLRWCVLTIRWNWTPKREISFSTSCSPVDYRTSKVF